MAGWTAECPECHGEITVEPQQLEASKRKVYVRQKPDGKKVEPSSDSCTLQEIATELRQLNATVSSIRWMMFWVIISPFLAAVLYAIYTVLSALFLP